MPPRTPAAAEMLYKESLEGVAARVERELRGLSGAGFVESQLALESALQEGLRAARGIERSARGAFTRVSTAGKQEVSNLLNVRLPAENVADMRNVFAQRQVQLVQRAVQDQVSALRLAVGTPDWEARVGELAYLRNRFRLIASNEVHKLHEAEVERWAERAGEPGGWYLTARDERVRPTHAQHEGKFFLFSERPAVMGEIDCRCRLIVGAKP